MNLPQWQGCCPCMPQHGHPEAQSHGGGPSPWTPAHIQCRQSSERGGGCTRLCLVPRAAGSWPARPFMPFSGPWAEAPKEGFSRAAHAERPPTCQAQKVGAASLASPCTWPARDSMHPWPAGRPRRARGLGLPGDSLPRPLLGVEVPSRCPPPALRPCDPRRMAQALPSAEGSRWEAAGLQRRETGRLLAREGSAGCRQGHLWGRHTHDRLCVVEGLARTLV